MYDKTCEVDGTIVKETPRFNIVEMELDPDDPCVFRQIDRSELSKGVKEPNFKEEIRRQELKRGLERKDVSDGDVVNVLNKHLDIEYPFNLYVTPDNPVIQDMVEGKTLQQICTKVKWVWIAEEELNGVVEDTGSFQKSFMGTPRMRTNPGKIASDCSEQANTLASMYRCWGRS